MKGSTMTKVAVLDDWQGVARASADWSPLLARADVVSLRGLSTMKMMPPPS